MRLLNQKVVVKRGKNFIDYIEKSMLYPINPQEILNHSYFHQLVNSNKETSSVLNAVPKKFRQVIVKNVQEFSGSKLSYLICYLTSKALSQNYNYKQVTSNLILNLRQFKNMSLVDTMGDIHSTIPLIYSGESYAEFLKKSKKLVDKLFINGEFNPRLATYHNYPDLSVIQRQIRKTIGGDIPISISFIGIIDDNELIQFTKNIQTIQQELNQTADLSRIYVTSVLCKNNLHIFYDHDIFKEDKIIDFKNIT